MIDGFNIVKASDVYDRLKKYRDTYNDRGVYLGFVDLHKHYSMQPGGVTDWTGYPISGKTQVLMECLLNASEFEGWRHLVYFPDVGSSIEVLADLIHKKTGKSFNPKHFNSIEDKDILGAIDWIAHHFHILTKENEKAKLTPFQFYDLAKQMKLDKLIDTASVDSWKDLRHDYADYGGYAQYLEEVLPYRNQIAETTNLHIHTIIHPRTPVKENGKFKPPVPYELKGGSEWFNSGKTMITVHRDSLLDNAVRIIFNKIKPRSVGEIGEIVFRFDVSKSRYYESRPNELNPNEHQHFYAKPRGVNNPDNSIIIKPDLNDYQGFDFDNKPDDLPF